MPWSPPSFPRSVRSLRPTAPNATRRPRPAGNGAHGMMCAVGMADAARARAFAAIDAGWEREVELLRRMVSQPSRLGEEAAVQRLIAGELESIGLGVDVWEIDPAALARHPAYGPVD